MKRVYQVEWPLNQISLTPGQQYYVTVQGSNDAGARGGVVGCSQPSLLPPALRCGRETAVFAVRPDSLASGLSTPLHPALACAAAAAAPAGQQLGTMLSSQPVVADTTPPYLPDGSSVYSGQDFTNQAVQVRFWCGTGGRRLIWRGCRRGGGSGRAQGSHPRLGPSRHSAHAAAALPLVWRSSDPARHPPPDRHLPPCLPAD